MRMIALIVAAALSLPAYAQVIDGSGISANGTRIDATGIHAGNASVIGRGVGAGAKGGRTINGNDADHDVNCHGGRLTVNGNRNTVTATDCASVTLTGNRNRLRWHRSRGETAVSNVGNGNSVRRF